MKAHVQAYLILKLTQPMTLHVMKAHTVHFLHQLTILNTDKCA